jgi:hypothetical protein
LRTSPIFNWYDYPAPLVHGQNAILADTGNLMRTGRTIKGHDTILRVMRDMPGAMIVISISDLAEPLKSGQNTI